MLIGLPIAILYFLARKITTEYGLRSSGEARIAEGRAQRNAEERRAFNYLSPLRAPLRTLRLNSLLVTVCPMSHVVPA